jgi:hypothetical protein
MRGHESYENTKVCVPTEIPTEADTDMRSRTPEATRATTVESLLHAVLVAAVGAVYPCSQ